MRSSFLVLVLAVGCGDYETSTDDLVDDLDGTGGDLLVEESGGSVGDGSGGADVSANSGGSSSSGGDVGSGGAQSSGGALATGGEPSSGGVSASGGASSGGASHSGGAVASGGANTGGAVSSGGSSTDELLVEIDFPVETFSNSYYSGPTPVETQFNISAHAVNRPPEVAHTTMVLITPAWSCGEVSTLSGDFEEDFSFWANEETSYEFGLSLSGAGGGFPAEGYVTTRLSGSSFTRWEAELTTNDCETSAGTPLTLSWTRGIVVRLYGTTAED